TSGTSVLLAFDWTQLAQQTVIGLSSGGTWALLALAIVLIYRSTGVVNFAQGEMAMFSVFIAWSLIHHGLTYWAAFFLTIAISIAGGVAVERVVIRPVEQAPVLTVVIVTLVLLWGLFRFTKLGLALRAAAVNPDESRLLGIRVSWMLALGWGLAAGLGAVSGMLTAPALASFDQ